MMTPAMIAIVSPEKTYGPATPHPKRPYSRTTATSLMVGAAIRNEKVTPSGMPDSTKPMNSGTAEHEQNGVTMPSIAASTFPIPCRRPPSRARVRSGLKKVRTIPITKIMPESRSRILGTSYRKNATDSPKRELHSRPRTSKVIHCDAGASTRYIAHQTSAINVSFITRRPSADVIVARGRAVSPVILTSGVGPVADRSPAWVRPRATVACETGGYQGRRLTQAALGLPMDLREAVVYAAT